LPPVNAGVRPLLKPALENACGNWKISGNFKQSNAKQFGRPCLASIHAHWRSPSLWKR